MINDEIYLFFNVYIKSYKVIGRNEYMRNLEGELWLVIWYPSNHNKWEMLYVGVMGEICDSAVSYAKPDPSTCSNNLFTAYANSQFGHFTAKCYALNMPKMTLHFLSPSLSTHITQIYHSISISKILFFFMTFILHF